MRNEETVGKETDFERSRAKRTMLSGILIRAIAIAMVIGFSSYLLTNEDITGNIKNLVDFLIPPIAVCIVILIVATAVNVVFKGEMATAASLSLTTIGLTVFIVMLFVLFSERTTDEYIRNLLLSFEIVSAASGIAVTAYIPVKRWTERGGKILSSFAMFALAIIAVKRFRGVFPDVWLAVLFIIMAAAAVFKLLSLLNRHRNPGVKRVGTFLGSALVKSIVAACVLIVTIYVMWMGPRIRELYPENASTVQWIVICIVLGLCSVALVAYLKNKSRDMDPEVWGKKINDVASLDPELMAASGTIRDFIDGGRKEGLIVAITAIMLSNGITEEAAGEILEGIVRYEDPEIRMVSVPTYIDIHAEAREERSKIVYFMLRAAASEMHAMRVIDEDGRYTTEEGF